MPFLVRSCTLGVLIAAAALACQAQDQAPLTLDAAVRLATQASRLVDARAAQARAAREMAVAAGQRPDPMLKAGINNLPIDGPDRFSVARDFMTMRSVGFSQELTRADKLSARAARFEREAESADAARALAIATVQRDTASAWFDRHYLGRMHELLLRQRDEARLGIDAAEAAYRGGRGSQPDVFAARLAAAQLDDRIAMTERELLSATTQLARWIGPASQRPTAPAPAIDAVALSEAELDGALDHHPDVAVMLRQEDLARADAEIARTNQRPDWSVELMLNQRGSAYSNMVSINFSLPLPWDRARRQDREESARLAEVERMRAEREDATRAHVAEARAMLQEWRGNRDRLALQDTRVLPVAAERVGAATAAYRAGSGTLVAVLDARRAELDARIERLKLEMDTARLWARLNYLAPAAHGDQP